MAVKRKAWKGPASYHSDLVPLLAWGLGIGWHAAEDAAQEAALGGLENDQILDYKSWLKKVALYNGLLTIRHKRTWEEHMDGIALRTSKSPSIRRPERNKAKWLDVFDRLSPPCRLYTAMS